MASARECRSQSARLSAPPEPGLSRWIPCPSYERREVLRHHADLLRQCRAAPRSRVLDPGRGHPRAAPPAAGGGRLLPHRDRRAWGADRGRGGERGDHAGRAGRPQRGQVRGARADHRRHQRLLHPHERPAARSEGRRDHAARLRQRLRPQGLLRRLVLPPLRRLQNRARGGARQHLPDPRDPARLGRRGELVLRALQIPGQAGSAVRGAAGLRRPRLPPQRGGRLHQRRAGRRLALPADAEMGPAAPLGPGPAHVRLVRRPPQLRHRAHLRPPRRGPHRALLARRPARDGEGHPQVPRGDLARPLHGRRTASRRTAWSSTATC